MPVPRWFYYLISAAFATLILVLGWGWHTLYISESRKVDEEINSIAHKIAEHVQNDNYGCYDLLRVLADKESKEKIAFAAGITQNRSKMTMSFAEKGAEATDKDPAEKTGSSNKVKLNIYPTGGKPLKIVIRPKEQDSNKPYVPAALRSIKYYDSLLMAALNSRRLSILFHTEKVTANDRSTAWATDPFIIDFYDPVVYRLVYKVPASLLVIRLLPYTCIVLFLLLLLCGAFLLFYKSYRLQLQMAQFKESLFSNVTHELKTPLSSLQLIIHSFSTDSAGLSAKQQEYIDFAGRELQRMNLLTEKILSFGKLDRQQFALNKEVIDLSILVEDAIQVMEIAARDRNAQIVFIPATGMKTKGDRILMLNMLVSIIDNALKYSTGKPHICISLRQEEQLLQIKITDNGIGIAPQYTTRIFDPFFRVPTGSEHNIKGHGLGLSFVQQVVKLHSGKILLESLPGKGSTFIILIPL